MMLERLMNNPYAWAFLAFIAIASLAYAIICQHLNKEKKEVSYRLQSNVLIRKNKSKYEKLSIMYAEKQIDNLCVSTFTIWNSGNRSLQSSDVVASKELTITASDKSSVLDASIICTSEPTNNFVIEILDERTVKIFFDYIDRNDGVVIQVIHTGSEEELSIDCKIIGGKPVRNSEKVRFENPFLQKIVIEKFLKVFSVSLIILSILILITAIVFTTSIFNPNLQSAIFASAEELETQDTSPQTTSIILSVVCWIYGLFMLLLFIPVVKRVFDVGIPKKLRRDPVSLELQKQKESQNSIYQSNSEFE